MMQDTTWFNSWDIVISFTKNSDIELVLCEFCSQLMLPEEGYIHSPRVFTLFSLSDFKQIHRNLWCP